MTGRGFVARIDTRREGVFAVTLADESHLVSWLAALWEDSDMGEPMPEDWREAAAALIEVPESGLLSVDET